MSHVTNTLLIYKAPLSTVGNANDVTAATAIVAAFTDVVLGSPANQDTPHTQVIMDAARNINPDIRFFGYTDLGGAADYATWQAQVGDWLGTFGPTSRYPLTGIFIDKFSPDFMLAPRPVQNDAVNYVHGLDYAAFVNGTDPSAIFGPDPSSNLSPAIGQDRSRTDYLLLENLIQDHINTQVKEARAHLRGRLEYAAWVQRTFNVRAAACIGAGAGMTLLPWQLWRSAIAMLTRHGIALYGIGDADYGATFHTYWLTNKANEGPPPWPAWCRHGWSPWTPWNPWTP